MNDEIAKVLMYEVKHGVAGVSVKYDCPYCETRLTSPLAEAGIVDTCPDCKRKFIVPGVDERLQMERRVSEERERKKALAAIRQEEADAAIRARVASKDRRKSKLQLARNPLREWGIYATAIAALLILAAGGHFYRALVTDQSGICIVIFILFLIGIVANFNACRSIKNEFRLAAKLLERIKEPDGFSKVAKELPAGVFHTHIKNLNDISRHDPSVSQDSLVMLLYSKMMSRSRIVEVLSGVLVSLGLIGTIVGLIAMTNGLSGTLNELDSDDASGLLVGMRSTMNGLGTAFYTTLVGAILGSIVLRVMNNIYTSNVDHFVSYIASLTEVQITPQLRQRSRARISNDGGSTSEISQ